MNEEMMIKLANVETADELNAILNENDLVLEEGVTPELFLETLNADSDELSADDLDGVAGGIVVTWAMTLAARRLGLSIAAYLKRYRNGCGPFGGGGGGSR